MTDTQDSTPRRMLRPNHNDRAHDLQLLRDVQIINDQTVRALGPLPPGGVPVAVKRKPNLPKPVRALQEPQAMTHSHDADTLSNGLPLPPIPQRLREMLKDYPGHLTRLQEVLNFVLDGPRPARGSTNHVFEQVIWALEGRLETFIHEAKDELEAAQASGDSEAVVHSKEKLSLMRRSRSRNGGINNLEEIWDYLETHQETFQ